MRLAISLVTLVVVLYSIIIPTTPNTLKSGAVISTKVVLKALCKEGVRGDELCPATSQFTDLSSLVMWRVEAFASQHARGKGTRERWSQIQPDLQHEVARAETFNRFYQESLKAGYVHTTQCLGAAFAANAYLVESIRRLEEEKFLEEPTDAKSADTAEWKTYRVDIFHSVKVKEAMSQIELLEVYHKIVNTLERHLQPQ